MKVLAISTRAALTVAALVMVNLALLTGCATVGSSPRHDHAALLAEAQGICPTHVVYVPKPDSCRLTHQWNAATPMFSTPQRLWGVAYAFNCGVQPGDFSFDQRLPAMDHMGIPGRDFHARSGSGYLMFSARAMTELLKTVPREFATDGAYTEVDIASACTWHVKALIGSDRDVAAAIPPIPAVVPPWWKDSPGQRDSSSSQGVHPGP